MFFNLRCETYNSFLLGFLLNLCFFEPTCPFYLKFNLSKTIQFLKRPWFLYVLSKYQAMFKALQWNARLWKIPTLKIALIGWITGLTPYCSSLLDSKAHVIVLFKLWNGSKHGINAYYLNCLNGKIVIGVLSVTLENGEWTYVSVVCIIIYIFF